MVLLSWCDFVMGPTSPKQLQDTLLGAVLIGGSSRRMGRDKARLPWRGRPLALHVAAALSAVAGEVVLVGSRPGDDRFPGVRTIADRRPGEGPLAGLHAALEAAGGRAVLLAACDLPGVSPELARWVAGSGLPPEGPPRARVPVADGRAQPLFALYSAACREPAEAALARGERSMTGFLERLAVERLVVTPALPFYHRDLMRNVNRPDDLEERRPS